MFKQFLCTLSGDDWGIIRLGDARLQRRFAAIGLFVLLIGLLCFVSGFFTFTQLFQSNLIGIPAGAFFSLMITNIYVFLLYTLTKNVHPHIQSNRSRWFSIAGRLVFIWLIAILVSKPIELLVFQVPIQAEVRSFKTGQLRQYQAISDQFYEDEIAVLQKAIDDQQRSGDKDYADEISREKQLIEKRFEEKQRFNVHMEQLVNHSNYYVRSIVILNNNYPICWLITILIMAVFTVPAYLKNFIPVTGIFYGRKRDIEKELISREYKEFKRLYSDIFRNRYRARVEFSEPFEDPPFNTIPKTEKRRFAAQDTLLKYIYNA